MSTSAPVLATPSAAELRRGVVRSLVKSGVFIVLSGAILFGVSGNWRWLSAWAYLAVIFGGLLWGALTLPAELLNERSGVKQGAKKWDVRLVFAFMLIGLVLIVMAALDARYRWSPSMPAMWKAGALFALIASTAFVHWAMTSNRFFAPVVRIQSERGHSVVMTGPYAYVRHPGYVGIIVSQLAVPLLLGSTIAFAIGVVGAVLLVVRTALEDRTLRQELPGYAEYAERVRYRLVPGLW